MLELFPSRAAGPFGRKLKHARGARIPVTVVTGFLGAGKTTLVRRFLETPEGRGTAVVVNEFGAVGIDDALVRASTDEVTLLGGIRHAIWDAGYGMDAPEREWLAMATAVGGLLLTIVVWAIGLAIF